MAIRPICLTSATATGAPDWFAESMLLILWTYDGWNEAAYIVAEVKNARRNLPLALILGTGMVTVIYLIINAAFLSALGFTARRARRCPRKSSVWRGGDFGATAIGVLIIVSSLGAINGMIFTTARIYSEFGADHRFFEPLSRWSPRWQTPVCSLVTQAALTLGFLVGISAWISLTARGNAPDNINNGFNELIYMTAAVFWLFFLLTGIAFFVLRHKDADRLRPFRVPGYPVVPLIFCVCCAYMVYRAILFRPGESLIALGILLLGVVFFFLPKKIKNPRDSEYLIPQLREFGQIFLFRRRITSQGYFFTTIRKGLPR